MTARNENRESSPSPNDLTLSKQLTSARRALDRDEPYEAWQMAQGGMAAADAEAQKKLLKLSLKALAIILEDIDEHGDANLSLYGEGARTSDDFRRLRDEAENALRRLSRDREPSPLPRFRLAQPRSPSGPPRRFATWLAPAPW